MKRPRRHVTLSLFPFLSVLLCTLGSLILLLLVLDQRAREQRIEERRREQAEQARQQAEALEEIESRRQAWVRERSALEADLREHRRQQEALIADRHGRNQELARARAALAASEMRVQAERAEADRLEANVARQSAAFPSLAERRSAAAAERERLLAAIRQMERTLSDLQAAVCQEAPPVFSLVPYRGKQGTRREPIYLEGVSNRLVFQPDGETLWPADLMAGDVLARKIEARAAALRRQADQPPYVLVLIRPSGINLYYAVMRALQGAAIEVGYELLDENVPIDFSEPSPEQLAAWDAAEASRPIDEPRWRPGGTGASSFANAAEPRSPTGSGEGKPLPNQPRVGLGGAGGQEAVQSTPSPPAGRAGSPAAGSVATARLGPPTSGATPSRPAAPGASADTPGSASNVGSPTGSQARASGPPGDSTTPGGGGEARAPGQTRGPRPVGDGGPREFDVAIECLAAGVRLPPDPALLDPTVPGEQNPVLRAVTESIQLRRKYDPAASPQLRFTIHPDGLRTYYQAAGALAKLKLPSSWEIVPSAEQRRP